MSPTEADLHIALIHPQIGPNAGNAGRLCLGIELVFIWYTLWGFPRLIKRCGVPDSTIGRTFGAWSTRAWPHFFLGGGTPGMGSFSEGKSPDLTGAV